MLSNDQYVFISKLFTTSTYYLALAPSPRKVRTKYLLLDPCKMLIGSGGWRGTSRCLPDLFGSSSPTLGLRVVGKNQPPILCWYNLLRTNAAWTICAVTRMTLILTPDPWNSPSGIRALFHALAIVVFLWMWN